MKEKQIFAIAAAFAFILPGLSQVTAADGDLDTTFGSGGIVRRVEAGLSVATDIAVQPDDKIIVVAQKNGNFVVLRYNADGSPDLAFGASGEATIDFPHSGISDTNDFPYAVAIQPDGKIVVAGSSQFALFRGTLADFALARLNTNGRLDSSFGTGGMVRTDFSTRDDTVNDVIIQPNGKILAVGQATVGNNVRFGIARYTSTGTLDPSFSGGGQKTIGWGGGYNIAYGVARQANGRIVVVGIATVDDSNGQPQAYFALARLDRKGMFDTTFGSNGKVFTSFSDSAGHLVPSWARSVAIQPDGQIVAAGNYSIIRDFAAARFNGSDGSLDAAFGTGGRIIATPYNSGTGGLADNRPVAINNGNIIMGGSAGSFAPCGLGFNRVIMLRYDHDGIPDTGFGVNGIVDFNPYPPLCVSGLSAFSFALQSDGKIVTVGRDIDLNGNVTLALARFQNGATPPGV